MRLFIHFTLVLVLALTFSIHAKAHDWENIVDLPSEAKAVLSFQKWQLPLPKEKKSRAKKPRTEEVIARVVHVHAGVVTLQIKDSTTKKIALNKLSPDYQKLALKWRKWNPRTVHFDDVREIKDNSGTLLFKAKLAATVGTNSAIYEQIDEEDGKTSHRFQLLHQLEPEERLRVYRKQFRGEFTPMKVVLKRGANIKKKGFIPYRWILKKGDTVEAMPAQLYIPTQDTPNQDLDTEKIPLVVFLHGLGQVGRNNTEQFKHSEFLSFISEENKKNYPCFLLCPQHLKEGSWFGSGPGKPNSSMEAVTDMVRMLINDYPQIDPSRVYVTGISSGGRGCLEFLTCWPNTYAAAVSMAATLKPKYFNENNARPFWIFWNRKDLPGAEKTLNEIKERYSEWNIPIKTTIYKRRIHNSWTQGYSTKELAPWLFSHQLSGTSK